jgi:hypothetical protein
MLNYLYIQFNTANRTQISVVAHTLVSSKNRIITKIYISPQLIAFTLKNENAFNTQYISWHVYADWSCTGNVILQNFTSMYEVSFTYRYQVHLTCRKQAVQTAIKENRVNDAYIPTTSCICCQIHTQRTGKDGWLMLRGIMQGSD